MVRDEAHALEAGFSNPVAQSRFVFRHVLDAMARPGTIQQFPNMVTAAPAPLFPSTAAVLLALADLETPIWLDERSKAEGSASEFLRFHTGAPIVTDKSAARFAVITEFTQLPRLEDFAQGRLEYPDRSTTLLVQVSELYQEGWVLTGPGVDGRRNFGFSPMPSGFLEQLAANHAAFPCGIDLLLLSERCLAALPRSTRIAGE